MAWTCSGSSNEELIENMWRNRLITDQRVKAAFLKVDRAHYAPSAAYQDSPQYIGHDATISAPHMHASAIEHVLPFLLPTEERKSPRVVDIGSGSGYLTHLLAELVGDSGRVVGVEHITALRNLGESNMQKSLDGNAFLTTGRVEFVVGDGRKGWEEGSTLWDVIHVGASAVELHQALIDQLNSPGCMFIPVDHGKTGDQYIWKVTKTKDGEVQKERLFGVRYVPLKDAPLDA